MNSNECLCHLPNIYKSGGKPTFPTPRLHELTLKSMMESLQINPNLAIELALRLGRWACPRSSDVLLDQLSIYSKLSASSIFIVAASLPCAAGVVLLVDLLGHQSGPFGS